MSAKNLDKHNRFRSITVGFRVSPEEHEHINVAVALSGLSKQEYCYRRCLGRDIVVQGNPKVYKALKDQLAAVLYELKRIDAGAEVDDELLAYAEKYPELCIQTDDDEQGGLRFEIDKRRVSVRLTAPYSQERRDAASKLAKKTNVFKTAN